MIEENHGHPAPLCDAGLSLMAHDQSLSQRKGAQDTGTLRTGGGRKPVIIFVTKPAPNEFFDPSAFSDLVLQGCPDHRQKKRPCAPSS